MSKSLGNIVSAKQALSRFSPDALRLFFLSSNYRNPLTYSEEAIAAQEKGLERLRNALKESSIETGHEMGAKAHREAFIAAMDDDLNTPQAIAALFDLARDINKEREAGKKVDNAQATLSELAGLLGLSLTESASAHSVDTIPLVDLLIELRGDLRKAKRYDLADKVRDRLAGLGVVLEDTPQGTQWKRVRS